MTQVQNYQPFATVLRNKPESLIDVLFKNALKTDFPFQNLGHEFKTGYPVDIYYENLETDPTLNFEFALPGVDPTDVEITKTKDGELHVKYETKRHDASSNRDYYSRSISKRNFDLIWKIPKRFDLDKMTAKFKNGLLTISIPRSQNSIPETVTIISE